MIPFADRTEAGELLAEKLAGYRDREDVVVVGLPRGGVVTAHAIASRLNFPLDLVVPRKVGHPAQPEFALGAVTEEGAVLLNEDLMRQTGVTEEQLLPVIAAEREEAARRIQVYRAGRPRYPLAGRTVLLVDDGIATGSTMKAAIVAVRAEDPREVVIAVPVLPADTLVEMERLADRVIFLATPSPFQAIGLHYTEFGQTGDAEVIELLKWRPK